MRSPWGSWVYSSGAWVNNTNPISINNVYGNAGDIQIAALAYPGSISYNVSATDGGGAFTYLTTATAGISLLHIFARILTNGNTHTVTATSSGSMSSNDYRRVQVYIVANPMKVSVSDLSTMYRVRNYTDVGLGYGATTYFPDCTTLKTSGGSRLDIGVTWREYDIQSGAQSGYSTPWESWATANVNGLGSTPYYAYSNGNGVGWGSGATSRTLEDIGRYNYSFSSGNNWADGGFGTIPYSNKCFNYNTSVYVQLPSFLGAVSFVIPNYGGTQMVL